MVVLWSTRSLSNRFTWQFAIWTRWFQAKPVHGGCWAWFPACGKVPHCNKMTLGERIVGSGCIMHVSQRWRRWLTSLEQRTSMFCVLMVRYVPVHTSTYQYILVHTRTYQDIPVHTRTYQFIPFLIWVQKRCKRVLNPRSSAYCSHAFLLHCKSTDTR